MHPTLDENLRAFYQTGFYMATYREVMDDPDKVAVDVAAIARLLRMSQEDVLLDWCAGYLRHSIPFAKMGMQVHALDFSEVEMKVGLEEAGRAGVTITPHICDFRKTPSEIQASVAVNLFTAGIGHLGEEADLAALKSLHGALRKGARFLLDYMSPYVISRDFQPIGYHVLGSPENLRLETRGFDFATSRLHARHWHVTSRGTEAVDLELRIYHPHELAGLLSQAGFTPLGFYGDFKGNPLTFESRRMVALALKL